MDDFKLKAKKSRAVPQVRKVGNQDIHRPLAIPFKIIPGVWSKQHHFNAFVPGFPGRVPGDHLRWTGHCPGLRFASRRQRAAQLQFGKPAGLEGRPGEIFRDGERRIGQHGHIFLTCLKRSSLIIPAKFP